MLIGQHRRWHQHGHLLTIASRFKGGTHGHLGFAEAHIAANQAIHGASTLHVGLHLLRGLALVGRVFVEEARLQLVLQITVFGKGKTLFLSALGIELYQIAGNILDALLGFLLQSLPRTRSECAQAWWFARVGTPVFADFIERMDAHIHLVVVLIDDAYHLLIAVAGGHAHQTAEFADTKIHMNNEVTGLHLLEFLHGERHFSGTRTVALEVVFVETVENLMVGEATQLERIVGKPFVKRFVHRLEANVFGGRAIHIGKDVAQALRLLFAVGQDVERVAMTQIIVEGGHQQIEILMEKWLGRDVKCHHAKHLFPTLCTISRRFGQRPDFNASERRRISNKLCGRHQRLGFAERLPDFLLFHLGGTRQLFGERLLGKAFFIDFPHCFAHESKIFGHQDTLLGQEFEKRNAMSFQHSQLGHDFHSVAFGFRKLILDFERADGINLLSKEIHAKRIFATEREDIEQAATHGKLAGLIDVVGFDETQLAQRMHHLGQIDCLPHLQRQAALIQLLFAHHPLGQRLGIAHHKQRRSSVGMG